MMIHVVVSRVLGLTSVRFAAVHYSSSYNRRLPMFAPTIDVSPFFFIMITELFTHGDISN